MKFTLEVKKRLPVNRYLHEMAVVLLSTRLHEIGEKQRCEVVVIRPEEFVLAIAKAAACVSACVQVIAMKSAGGSEGTTASDGAEAVSLRSAAVDDWQEVH